MNDRGVFPKGSSLEVHEHHGIPRAQKHRMTLCWQCYFVCLPDIILSRLTRFFPEKILKSKVTLDLIEHGIGASDSPKNTWSTCICFLGSAWKYRNTVSGQLPARQCRIQNWFVLGIQRTSARVLFIHVCTSILKECVLFHWVHDAAWLLELRRRHFNDWVRFSFHDPKPWSSLLVEKMFTRSPSEDLCSIVSRTIDYWHFSILYFCSADPCPPVAHMWLLAPSTQGLSSATYNCLRE